MPLDWIAARLHMGARSTVSREVGALAKVLPKDKKLTKLYQQLQAAVYMTGISNIKHLRPFPRRWHLEIQRTQGGAWTLRNGKLKQRVRNSGVFAVFLTISGIFANSPLLEPIDGRPGAAWHHTWATLSDNPGNIARALIRPAFSGPFMISVFNDKGGVTTASLAIDPIVERNSRTSPEKRLIHRQSKRIPNSIAAKLNRAWLKELLKTRFADEPSLRFHDATEIIYSCSAIGYPFLLGASDYPNTQGKADDYLKALSELLIEYVKAIEKSEENLVLVKIDQLLEAQGAKVQTPKSNKQK